MIALFTSLMYIVARGRIVFEFSMEVPSLHFGYSPKHSPQDSGFNLSSSYSKHNCNRVSSDTTPSRGISREFGREGGGGGGWGF